MQRVFLIVILIFSDVIASAQGTTRYEAYEAPMPNPANSSNPSGGGLFRFSPEGNLVSLVWVNFGRETDLVKVYRSESANLLGVELFTLQATAPYQVDSEPGTYPGWQFTAVTGVTSAQIADLNAGLWWVGVNRPGVGEILRGQILPVPEPSTYALIALGWVLFGSCRRRTRIKEDSTPHQT
jgi:hypothetical protein